MKRYALALRFPELHNHLHQFIRRHNTMFRDITDIIRYPDSATRAVRLRRDLEYPFETVLTKQDVPPSHPLYDLLGDVKINDVPVVGFLAGRTGHVPVYVMLYVDSMRDVRAFVPKKGNALNPLSYTLYGMSPSDDDRVAHFLLKRPYIELDLTDSETLGAFYSREMLLKTARGRLSPVEPYII